jgi:hypothetical protein
MGQDNRIRKAGMGVKPFTEIADDLMQHPGYGPSNQFIHTGLE